MQTAFVCHGNLEGLVGAREEVTGWLLKLLDCKTQPFLQAHALTFVTVSQTFSHMCDFLTKLPGDRKRKSYQRSLTSNEMVTPRSQEGSLRSLKLVRF